MKFLGLVIAAAATSVSALGGLGGMKDSNGCYSSAGYSWCESSSKCLRLWEEDCADTKSAKTTTTGNPPVVGGSSDGECCTTCGYVFCKEQNKCVQSWLDSTKSDCPSLFQDGGALVVSSR